MKNLKIVFFGTPEFAVASLDRLIKDGWDIAAVVTMPDKIAGRGHKMIQSDVKNTPLNTISGFSSRKSSNLPISSTP